MQQHQVFREIKQLIGTRVEPKHCATKPHLRELAGAEASGAGYIVREFIAASIRSVEGPCWIEDIELSADQIKRALRVLLGIDRTFNCAGPRRWLVAEELGLCCGVDKFRREYGPESDLCWILARVMTGQTAESN